MDVPLALLADSANVSAEGNLNILGIFDAVVASEYPAAHPAATLVIQLRPRRSEVGMPARVVIRLMDEDSVIAEIQGEFIVPALTPGGRVMGINQLFRIAPLGLPRAGNFAFHILVNEEEKAVVPFEALVRPADPAG